MTIRLIAIIIISTTFCGINLNAQSVNIQSGTVIINPSFIDYQKNFSRPNEAFKRKEDTLRKQFSEKNLKWPARYVYFRSFKYDSQMEVWVKDELSEPFKLFKTYNVCALAGSLGPKRVEGDYQVPEGFYIINVFNPASAFHLSLGLNYPNVSDRILSDPIHPGGEIFIHGSCVTTGCLPMTDGKMEDIYIIAVYAKSMGQDFIPVHIFPVRFNVARSTDYLDKFVKDDTQLIKFASKLEDAFDYFEHYHQLPVIMINEKGDYFINDVLPRKRKNKNAPNVKKEPVQHRYRDIQGLAESVHEWPQFPGGSKAFLKYLNALGKEMSVFLPEGQHKAFVKVEYIIDKDGVPTNFKLTKSINEEFDDKLISRMENMGTWKPAILQGKPVAKKMVQTFTVEKL